MEIWRDIKRAKLKPLKTRVTKLPNETNQEFFIRAGKIGGKLNGVPIKCLQNNRIYSSAGEASRELNIDRSSINKYLRGEIKTSVRGYTFQKI